MAALAPDITGSSPHTGARTVTVEVVSAVPAARDAITFALAVPGTRRAPAPYRPGQFITLTVPHSGATLCRSYSLCGDGRPDIPWEITVKRVRGGVVSNYLLDHLRPGMSLRASIPQGTFTLPTGLRPDSLLIFVAAGSGIAPLYGMLRAVVRMHPAQRPRVQLHYAHHSPADAIFGRQLSALDRERLWLTQRWYVSSNGRRLTPQAVLATGGPEAASAEWFLCGPTALTREVREAALRWGVPAPRLHTEIFASPAARMPGAPSSAASAQPIARVRLADSGALLAAQSGETLLETLERSGYRPDFSCRAGACGTCKLKLTSGYVCDGAGGSGALTASEQAEGYILSCVAQPQSDITLATAGERVAAPAYTASGPARSAPLGPPRWLRPLRRSLAAAAVAAFIGMWGLTAHVLTGHSSTASSSSTSGATSSTPATNTGGTTSGSSTPSGSSAIQTQPGSSSVNASTGVS